MKSFIKTCGRRSLFRRFAAPGAAALLLWIAAGTVRVSAIDPPSLHLAINGNRGPFAIAFSADGSRALVTEFDEGALAVVETASGQVSAHIPTGGTQPTGVAVTPDGLHAVVANSLSGSVAFIDLVSRRADVVTAPGVPWGVALSPDGSRAYVSISQLDLVAVFNTVSHARIGTIPTGRRPRALAITPDGTTLVSANLSAGSVSYLDTAALKERSRGLTPAVNLRGVALFPDGRTVFAVGQRAQNERPTQTAVGIWSNQAFVQVPNGPRNGIQNLWLDLMGSDVADPDSVVMDSANSRAFVTCSGGNSLNVVPVRGDGDTVTVHNVGAQPRGLAMTPNRREVWIANLLSNDIAVVDTTTLKIKRRIDLGTTTHRDPHMLGRYLFGSADIVKGAQFSCNSCHPDGGSDGISWKFVHVPDALGKTIDRNVKGLRGGIAAAPPYRWSGHEPSLAAFIREEVPGLLQGPNLTPQQVESVAGYVGTLPLAPNPFRNPDGSFTGAALRGKLLFEGKAECVSCHGGGSAGRGRKIERVWIGTTPPGVMLQVPRLEGVFDTDPYLHDGAAKTLEEIFSEHNAQKLHGKANILSESEMSDLLTFVKEL